MKNDDSGKRASELYTTMDTISDFCRNNLRRAFVDEFNFVSRYQDDGLILTPRRTRRDLGGTRHYVGASHE